MSDGNLALHLHAHLPFVRHPEHPQFLEERWFFDAIVDTYVPLILRFERLHNEGIPFRLSMTLSPTLLAMFADGLLQERLSHHLARQNELCDKEMNRTAAQPDFHEVVLMYHQRYTEVERTLARFGGNLANAFRMLADLGHLELTTCGATHGFLPHMQLIDGAVDRQLGLAVETHQRILERKPDGIWLPECAYYPGLEEKLAAHGLVYFFVDSHALHLGNPRSSRGVHSHVFLPNGVAAFGRDAESSRQVWSMQEGYPGDGLYRDFYRDVGFDLPLDYVAPYVHLGDTRILTGFKYHAITGETEHKNVYDRPAALKKAEEHANHFVWCREKQFNFLSEHMDRTPLVLAPYDAELYGHWWFEGPDFLYYVLKAAAGNRSVNTIAARDHLVQFPSAQVVTPNASSWGDGGYYRVWINASNEWIYPHLHAAASLMPSERPTEPGWQQEAFDQAARELVLAQSSDWPFIMTTGTSPDYAARRTTRHLANFHYLRQALETGRRPDRLDEMQWLNKIF